MKVQRWQTVQIAFLSLATLVFAACGGGGGSGGTASPLASLQGTWRGAYNNSTSDLTLEVTVNGSGQITDIRQGGFSQGVTGTIAHEQGNIYSFTLSDNTEGGFMTDASAAHAGFVDEDGGFGVLQKGAPGQANNYTAADIQRDWAGYSVELDSFMNVTASGSSSATHVSGNEFAVTDRNGTFSAFFGSPTSSGLGRYAGTWNENGVVFGSANAWLSADKTFAASWACATPSLGTAGNFPNCTFAIWTGQ